MYACRLRNAEQLVLVSKNKKFKIGSDMNQIEIIPKGSLIIDNQGKIAAIGTTEELDAKFSQCTFATDLDCTGKSVIPGLIDGHTHPVWTGDRCHEFSMKLAGATYMDIHKQGGGIGFTVRHVREASEELLAKSLEKRLNIMLKNGTTLCEAKSGYGLNMESEMKMLRVIQTVATQSPVELVATYLGAHSVPKDSNLQDYTEDIIKKHIPELVAQKSQGLMNPEFIDVFHEHNVFETEQTRRILQAGKEAGLAINFHGDELHPMKSAELAAEVGAVTVSHLEKISDQGIVQMAKSGIVALLLPTTAYVLRIEYPPARKIIDAGVPVSLASDFNPNAHCMSLPFVMNLACVQMKMTMNEALVACTINAAASLNKSETHGSLEVGKQGDVVIIDHPNWEHLIYELVDPPIEAVIKRGKVVHKKQ